jgi:hypothetical protein
MLQGPIARIASLEERITALGPITWQEIRTAVRTGDITNYLMVGDQVLVSHATYGNIVFDVVDIGDATASASWVPSGYFDATPDAKPVTLLMNRCSYGAQFDAPEANYKVLVAIAAGNVNISLTSSAVNSGNAATYDLTVPAGGFAKDSLLRIKDASPTTGPGAKLLYYATPTATAVEVTLTPGAVNTPLTVSPTEAAQLSVQNHKDRVMYGSNNYAQSALRQWLNAAGAKTTFWLPKSIYDLPPSWNGTWDGFLNGMDAEFVAAVGATTRIVANNTVTDGGGVTASYTIADKFFLPSAMEIYNTKENNVAEGVQFDAYVGLADINKIKYQYAAPSTAGYWWMRSPDASYTYRARYVNNTTGALNYYYAYFGYGAAAACVIL